MKKNAEPEDLVTWAEHYLRARDAFERKMVSMERVDGMLKVVYKNRTVTVVGQEKLDTSGALLKGAVTIVTLQTDENFKTLVSSFDTFAKHDDLTMIFVNPKTNEKWLLKPHVHASVADKTSLEAGLTTMFQTVHVV